MLSAVKLAQVQFIDHTPMSRSILGLRLLNLVSPYLLSLNLVYAKKEAQAPSKNGMWTLLMTRGVRRRHLLRVLLEVYIFRFVYGEKWIMMHDLCCSWDLSES